MIRHRTLIALIETEPESRAARASMLGLYGLAVLQYGSAEDYLADPDALDARCLVVDGELGTGMSGFELTEAIAASVGPPVIVMTRGSHPEFANHVMHLPCSALLVKPFPPERLVVAILAVTVELDLEHHG